MIFKSASNAIFIYGCMLLPIKSGAQDNDHVILRAMKDEMKRSMTEIRYEGHDKPFFISYGITDVKSFSAYATLGAIVQSGQVNNRGKSVRVLVGNYEFNDESLDNNLFSDPAANEIQLPLDDDYLGIRRALWTTTDVVFKGAAQKYKKHQGTLKEQNKMLKDVPHRTFAQVPIMQSIKPLPTYLLDKRKWIYYCKEVSAVFEKYPEIESSDVAMNVSYGSHYFVSSEGTVVVAPYHVAVIQCRARIKTEKGEPVFDNIIHYAKTPEEFPSLEQLVAQSKELAEKLMYLKKANVLEEEYSGPVLFLGSSVAQIFATPLFSFRESLVSSNAIVNSAEFRPDAVTSLDSRLGKIIIDHTLTIKAKPTLKKFREKILLGSYEVDDEGVVPKDELILVEHGVLKNLLNDRSLTKEGQTANGHSTGPAVIEITSNKTTPIRALKDALIAQAKMQGLDFAIIVKENAGFSEGMAEIWKVNLETGKEELMRSAQLTSVSLKNLRRITGLAQEQHAYTIQTSDGNLASFIVPEAILLDDIDIRPFSLPYLENEEIYVQSPLKN
jgi:PmbA/TldA metallopeptidase C-terminal domain